MPRHAAAYMLKCAPVRRRGNLINAAARRGLHAEMRACAPSRQSHYTRGFAASGPLNRDGGLL
jgi:hypothetical protein